MTPTPEVMPGAEPFAATGGDVGVLVSHGFTGNPQSMRPLAEAFADAGYTVELPLLPGHGTSLDEMLKTGWDDWSGALERVYLGLAERCRSVVVAGLSMGGTLTAWLATEHPEISGIITINGAFESQGELAPMLQMMLDNGDTVMDGIGSDVADPDVTELAYDKTPIGPLLSLGKAIDDLQPKLASIECPALVLVSPQDHVVAPTSSQHLADSVSGPVEVVRLERSYHVATIDFDKDLIIEKSLDFVKRVTSS